MSFMFGFVLLFSSQLIISFPAMQIKNPYKRLSEFWGMVDAKHVALISEQLNGTTVLDMGSGYGTTTSTLTKAGVQCTGIDLDNEAIQKSKKLFPECTFITANAESLPFPD